MRFEMDLVASVLLISYVFGATKFKNGRKALYKLNYPKVVDDKLSTILAERFLEVCSISKHDRFHVFGVANSGIHLASAVLRSVGGLDGGRNIFTILDLNNNKYFFECVCSEEVTLLVDNAITSGKTIRAAFNVLNAHGHKPLKIIRYFDREELDDNGSYISDELEKELGVEIVSLFSVRDLLRIIPEDQKNIIINHLKKNGNIHIKKFLEKNDVF